MTTSRVSERGKPPARKGTAKKKAEEKVFVGRIKSRDLDVHYPPGYTVITYVYTKRSEAEREKLRSTFNSTARESFLKHLAAEKEAELRKAGLDDDDIQRVKDGLCPVGWQVHHKKSIDDNGTNDFDNLVLIDNDPYHIAITNAQNTACGDLKPGESKRLDFPIPNGVVYPPVAPR